MQIESIPVEKLVEHPSNANRMNNETFGKLCRHIERSGRYEPIAVRPAPDSAGFYQIINGHHRAKALKKLGHRDADCIVWDVDDAQTDILLATLNRLCGKDVPALRARLVGSLAASFGTESLSELLADSAAAIAKSLSQLSGQSKVKKPAPMLEPMIFFLTVRQKQVVLDAIDHITTGTMGLNQSQRRVAGLMRIAELYAAESADNRILTGRSCDE